MRLALGSAILLVSRQLSQLLPVRLKRLVALRAVVRGGILLLFIIGAGPTPSHAATELGTLTIQSEPSVQVIWDGTLLGTTDTSGQMSIGSIPPGTYTLAFTSPGFTARTESVDITAGRQEVDASLAEIAQPSVGAGLAPARGADSPADDATSQAPGPKSQDYLFTTALLVVVAALILTAFLLADRQSRRRQTAAKPEGPRIVLPTASERTKKLPTFYDDLKRRETDLEQLVDVGSGRSQRQVIDVQVEDHGPVEDDS